MILIYAVATTIVSAMLNIYGRHVLKDVSAHAYAVVANLIGGIIFIPIALSNISFVTTSQTLVALFMSSCVWATAIILNTLSNKMAHVSVRAPVSQSKLLWVLIFSVVLLKESVSLQQAGAIGIIFIGLSILLWHPEYKFGSLKDPGIRWTLVGAVVSALTAIVDKYALNFVSVELYGLFMFTLPGVILLLFTPKKGEDIRHILRVHLKRILPISLMMVGSYYGALKMYSLLPISIAYPILQFSTLITVVGGIFILKEKEHLWQKIIAAIFVIIGSVIFKLG